MIGNSNNHSIKSSTWLAQPGLAHVVQFYSSGHGLIRNLLRYVGSAIQAGNVCIVVATDERIKKLDMQLAGIIDVDEAKRTKQYITLDAAEALDDFMVDGLPDKKLFYETIGALVEEVSRTGQPIRIYGEMVALLWGQGNKEAVMRLEELWNELAIDNPFSLYCAYPELHFIMDPDVRHTIQDYHMPLNYGAAQS